MTSGLDDRDEFGRIRKNGSSGQGDSESREGRNRNGRDDGSNNSNFNDNKDPLHPPPSAREEDYYGPAGNAQHQQEEQAGLHPGLVVKGVVSRIESYGAFIEFDVVEPGNRKVSHRGLAHVSQLATHRVADVSEILQLKQDVYAVVLDVEYQQRHQARIRLSLKDIDQSNGEYRGDQSRLRGNGSRQRPLSEGQLNRRAKDRRDLYMGFRVHWQPDGNDRRDRRNASPEYLRSLWSSSPEPPSSSNAGTEHTSFALSRFALLFAISSDGTNRLL